MVSPQLKRKAAHLLKSEQHLSVRRACKTVALGRSTYHYKPKKTTDKEMKLKNEIVKLSIAKPRYGYRRITALLLRSGWIVNLKKVQKVRREEGLKVSSKKPRKRNHKPSEHKLTKAKCRNHVWTWDFTFDRTDSGSPIKILALIDEYTRRWLTFRVERSLTHKEVLETLLQAVKKHGAPKFIRSDNGPEFIAKRLKKVLKEQKIAINYIEKGSPWENGKIESFNGKLKDECLDRESFYNLTEARVILQDHQREYNHERPHSSLGYQTPEEFYHKTLEEECRKYLQALLFLQSKSMKY